MKSIVRIAVLAVLGIVALSCASSRTLTMMQDLVPDETFPVPEAPDVIVHTGDRLSISVTGKNRELALPFNVSGGIVSVDTEGNTDAAEKDHSYLVDEHGEIDFPVLGRLKVAGLSITEIKELISGDISGRNMLESPNVTINLDNFKVTMLGEVANKGNMQVNANQINLLQAIAQAGDLTTSANLKDVTVIRTSTGERTVYSVNLYSKDLYNSPAFYLQQNDIVYVKPRGSKLDSTSDLTLRLFQILLSVLSTTSTVLFWATRK